MEFRAKVGDNSESARGTVEAAPVPEHTDADRSRDDMPSAKSTRSPAFQFYPSDFLSSTKVDRMSMTERGAYITLLSRCWLDDGLPTDLTDLAAMVRMKPSQFERMWNSGQLSRCFEERAGRLVNPRQQKERKKQAAFQARQAANGAKGGRPPKTHSEPMGFSGLTHSKPRALKIETEILAGVPSLEKEGEPELDGQVLFLALVECYPPERRTDDQPTQIAFLDALGPYAEWQGRYDLMLKTLAEHKASEQWKNPRFAPNLITWLKRGDWRGTRKLALAATGTEGRGRTGSTRGKLDGFEEQD